MRPECDFNVLLQRLTKEHMKSGNPVTSIGVGSHLGLVYCVRLKRKTMHVVSQTRTATYSVGEVSFWGPVVRCANFLPSPGPISPASNARGMGLTTTSRNPL
ncbi:hypothetical protein DL546_008676 [Coniochaeta pulveracea]|uniref:Uncharacterized protein n=1 Tax=Coniochaeta pulveracea TaxID=177199 RepID=A0A420YDW0_9PEZI|nr:hypothetical protein DL546_008676 [Coniochaeta pulveracea]